MKSYSLALGAMICVIGLLAPTTAVALSGDDAVGVWRTKTGRHVQLFKCGASLCGKIVKAKAGEKDSKNPNPKLRKRSIQGVRILSGAKKSGAKAWKGTLYNTRNGKLYTGYITVKSKSVVALSGCVLGGLICQGENWSRVR